MEDVEPVEGLTIIKVEDTRLALAYMSAAYFGNPAEKNYYCRYYRNKR